MTIPSRPAPPPPQASNRLPTNRYSPATNWDDTPFSNAVAAQPQVKKAPPPRPPPPKVVPALKKPGQAQSINILSNLFGQKRGSSQKPPVSQKPVLMKLPPPPKLPPPNQSNSASSTTATSELISFDSPPSSPTFTQKSCSDCISVDSFSSDSNYSSPNNGNMSQAESGFEDDFVVSNTEHGRRSKVTTPSATISTSSSSRDLWDLSDPFGMPATTGSTSSNSTIYAPVGSATIRVPTVNSKLYDPDFVDPLCNGKTVAPKVQTIAKPTIIKSVNGSSSSSSAASSQKSTPIHHHLEIKPKPILTPPIWSIKPAAMPAPLPAPIPPVTSSFDDPEEEEESLDSLPSLPMPNIPPPPPPVVVEDDVTTGSRFEEAHQDPYGIAMYDFAGETDEDLSFRTNDKIYLLKRLNEEWFLGRDRRGCEGMFPANYIEVRIALPGDRQSQSSSTTTSSSSHNSYNGSSSSISSFNPPKVRILYTFNAETPEDLTIYENEFVTVLHQITAEWLYGESRGQRGQFPANFIEYVPSNLPLVPPPNTN